MPHLFISAAHKSSGKTTLSIGLCAALVERGHIIQPFKKGPDYIDPIWLTAASGRACHNLDFNTMTNDEILQTFQHYGNDADISIIEANKGLYDGVALDGSDSNAAIAKLIKSPVILVINAVGITRGVAPLLLGYQSFDSDVQIKGVIFNMVAGSRHESKLRNVTETYTDIPVLGAVYRNSAMQIEERHLGLMPSNEDSQAHQQIQQISDLVKEQVDLDRLVSIAKSAASITPLPLPVLTGSKPSGYVKIAVCKDPSFGFYYPGDLEALENSGAELIEVNTLTDSNLPTVDGLFIGGGFPETHMEQLSHNHGMRTSIKQAIESGLPTYAECGGLMYLAENLIWNDKCSEMVGVIPANVVMHKKPQGRGYIRLTETDDMPWPDKKPADATINAHEFHYSQLEGLKSKGKFAYKVLRGQGIDGEHDGWIYKNLLASYAHMRDTAQNHWAERFVAFVRKNRRQ